MDAKPQRPRATLRTTDENMPLPAVAGGKSLHQRTKSTGALPTSQSVAAKANTKKVLGEANKNLPINKAAPKDDSDIGKVSPGKLKAQQEAEKMARPMAAKPIQGALPQAQPAEKAIHVQHLLPHIVPSATISLVKGASYSNVAEVTSAAHLAKLINEHALATGDPSVQAVVNHANGKPELHAIFTKTKTESVPLRDEAAAQPPTVPLQSLNIEVAPERSYSDELAELRHRVANGIAPDWTPKPEKPVNPVGDDEAEDDDDDYLTTGSLNFTGTTTVLFNPRFTQKHEAQIAAAKLFVETTRTPEDIEDEEWDTSMVAEYSDEIFEYMREMEVRMSPNPYYMDQQSEVQWSMRSVLVDWVVQVHQRFNLLPETLFLTVNYIDRFLSAKVVSLGKLQLVGATAIFLAAKYEEVNCPTIAEIIYMVDGGYSADELIKAERFMLSMLQFEMGWPGPMSFLRRISKADDYDLETRTLAKYFLEVTIMDERFVGLTPSYLAAGAHCMARLMLRKGDWTQAHVYYSNYTFSQLKKLLRGIKACCNNPTVHHLAVYDKYTDKRFKRASTFVAGEMAKGFQLPFSRESSMGVHHGYGMQ